MGEVTLRENQRDYFFEQSKRNFRAIVISSKLSSIEVEPIEEKDKKLLSDRVSIGLGKDNDMLYTREFNC